MGFENIDTTNLSIEQKVVLHLAKTGFLTSTGDITRALKEQAYAEYLILGVGIDEDDLCEHEPLTNEEIQVVFDNDNEA